MQRSSRINRTIFVDVCRRDLAAFSALSLRAASDGCLSHLILTQSERCCIEMGRKRRYSYVRVDFCGFKVAAHGGARKAGRHSKNEKIRMTKTQKKKNVFVFRRRWVHRICLFQQSTVLSRLYSRWFCADKIGFAMFVGAVNIQELLRLPVRFIFENYQANGALRYEYIVCKCQPTSRRMRFFFLALQCN